MSSSPRISNITSHWVTTRGGIEIFDTRKLIDIEWINHKFPIRGSRSEPALDRKELRGAFKDRKLFGLESQC